MKFIKLGVTIIALLFNLYSCNNKYAKDVEIPIRLAKDYYSDWGLEAIGFIPDASVDNIKIAVLDSGTNEHFPQIVASYSTVDESSGYFDDINHGTLIIKKLVQLVPSAKIVSIKVFNSNESMNPIALKNGIEIAIENDVDIINISLGYTEYSEDVAEAINAAKEKGILIVAAAGNQGESSLLYPAMHDGVISVISRDINNKDSQMNNYSIQKKSFSAPGEHIYISENNFVTGTSIACVFVSAIISMIKCNSNLTPEEIIETLIQTSIYPTEYSYGLIQYDTLTQNEEPVKRSY